MELENKATALWSNFLNVKMVQIRTFHMTWFAFFACFFAWFGIAPLMSVVRDELALSHEQVGWAIIGSVSMTIFARLFIGWLVDRIGPRKSYTWLLILGSLPVMGIGLAHSFETFLLFRVLSPRVADSGQTSFAAEHRLMQRVSQAWAAAAEIRVFGITGTFANDVKQARAERARANASAVVMTSAPQYLLELALVTGLGLLAAGMVAVGRADSVLTVVAVLAVAALRLLPALLRLQSGLTTAKHNTSWAEALTAELDTLTTISAQARAAESPRDGALLHLAGVGVQYEGRDRPTLAGVDLTLNPGDRIGVIGSSGSGKSTLAAVILGLIAPTAGTVERTAVRAALLSQDAPVLAGTIRENLVFARPWLADTTDDRLREVLAAAGLSEEIDALPDGLDSQAGEAGRSLSGGQRQRLGLARALLDEPALIVLDEPTSQLDDQNAQWVRAAVEKLSDDVVVVFVTHRPQLLEGFERVLLVQDGRVVEVGGRIRT